MSHQEDDVSDQNEQDQNERVPVVNTVTGGRTTMIRKVVARYGPDWRECTPEELAPDPTQAPAAAAPGTFDEPDSGATEQE